MTDARTLPLVSIVFLAYNRREHLLQSLAVMLEHSGYPRERLEVIVVDNASEDGTPAAVAARYAEVQIIRNPENLGAPGWNRGFATARGQYVLVLDDDAYLPSGELERAVTAAAAEGADLVSFTVVSSNDRDHALNDDWQTGLLSFWGCAALVRRKALDVLGGYDPEIFIWGNEAEFTMRLLDRGFKHLFIPDVRAVHMKAPIVSFDLQRYLVNAGHHAYIAGKLMTPADAAATVFNLIARATVDALRERPAAVLAIPKVVAGVTRGVGHRRPVRSTVSAAYRRHFAPLVAPWQFMRSPGERLRRTGRGAADVTQLRAERRARFYARRRIFYPVGRGSLRL